MNYVDCADEPGRRSASDEGMTAMDRLVLAPAVEVGGAAQNASERRRVAEVLRGGVEAVSVEHTASAGLSGTSA